MYRKVWTASDQCPLGYLLIDPQERFRQNQEFNVDKKILTSLNTKLERENEHMRTLQRLSTQAARAPTTAVVLEWHDGVNEVAGIEDAILTLAVRIEECVFGRSALATLNICTL